MMIHASDNDNTQQRTSQTYLTSCSSQCCPELAAFTQPWLNWKEIHFFPLKNNVSCCSDRSQKHRIGATRHSYNSELGKFQQQSRCSPADFHYPNTRAATVCMQQGWLSHGEQPHPCDALLMYRLRLSLPLKWQLPGHRSGLIQKGKPWSPVQLVLLSC